MAGRPSEMETGAAIRIAMSVLAGGASEGTLLEVQEEDGAGGVAFGERRGVIQSNLTIGANLAALRELRANAGIAFTGMYPLGQGFVIAPSELQDATGGVQREIDALRPFVIARDMAQKNRGTSIIDFYPRSEDDCRRQFPHLFRWVIERVKPHRDSDNRASRRQKWWLFAETVPALREATKELDRFILVPRTSKRFSFQFFKTDVVPDTSVVAIASGDAFLLGVLSSRVHITWAEKFGGRLGVGNDPRYQHKMTFRPFPFPDSVLTKMEKIRALAEELDAFRKERQKAHPDLTITEMYNVLEKLRRGEKLEKKEPEVHQKGLVTVLKKIHDDLDAAVFEAYGWPGTLSDEEILERLVALNAERAEEERQGKVRWLRPEYQNPKGEKPASQEKLGEEEEEGEEGEEEAGPKKPAWPGKTRERIVAVRDLLLGQGEGWTVEQVARSFKGANQEAIAEVLESLEALGLVVSYEDQQARCWRRAGAPAGEGPSSRRVSVRPSSAPAARPEADEVTQAIAWLEGVREKEAVFSALVEMNHRLDHWFREGREALCVQLLERVAPEKIEEGLLVGLLMNSVRGGEPLVEPRRQFRERIRPVLVEKVGEERTRKILGRSA